MAHRSSIPRPRRLGVALGIGAGYARVVRVEVCAGAAGDDLVAGDVSASARASYRVATLEQIGAARRGRRGRDPAALAGAE